MAPRVAPHENHDWSSVGIFKGPSIRRPAQVPRSPTFRMRGLGWGPEPGRRSARFNVVQAGPGEGGGVGEWGVGGYQGT